MLSAGHLDRTLVIEQPVVTRDAADGSQVVTWSAVATVWAQLLESSTSGDEMMRDGVLSYGRPSRVRIRWRSGIEPTMRLNIGGRLLQILGTAEIGRRRLLEISCREWAHE
jgi:SPP1 family predicted phage head-tail adaptor